MGYVYVMSVVSAGFLAVLLLALATEESRRGGLKRVLKGFPRFMPGPLLYENGTGIAVDEARRTVCLISSRRRNMKLNLVPFRDIVGCAVVRNGRRVIQACAAGRHLVAGARPAAALELRLYTADRHVPEHIVAVSGMEEALRWHYLLKVLVERDRRRAAPAPTGVPAAVEPARSGAQAGEAALRAQVREVVETFIMPGLAAAPWFVIGERELRDRCGMELPLARFHAHLNRLKREKAFAAAALSYSRKDESWRISRRKRS